MWALWIALVLFSACLGLVVGWFFGAYSVLRYLKRRYRPLYDVLMEQYGRRIR